MKWHVPLMTLLSLYSSHIVSCDQATFERRQKKVALIGALSSQDIRYVRTNKEEITIVSLRDQSIRHTAFPNYPATFALKGFRVKVTVTTAKSAPIDDETDIDQDMALEVTVFLDDKDNTDLKDDACLYFFQPEKAQSLEKYLADNNK